MEIVYIHHSCFMLHLPDRSFLFDCPSEEHLPREAAAALERELPGRNLAVFSSHSHGDHFHPELERITSPADQSVFVLSYDVEEMFPESVPPGSLIMEPDQEEIVGDMTVTTLESNDLGVSFLISPPGETIYFGGDLASWDWPSAPEPDRRFAREFFLQALERIGRYRIDVAFSNLDGRLPSLAGGPEFIRTVRPGLFVPMHGFGDTREMIHLVDRVQEEFPDQRFFRYLKPGDRFSLP